MAKKELPVRHQRRIKGVKRKHVGSAVLRDIELCIEREMARYNVSRSFVIANALAYTFSIDFESYLPEKESKNGSRTVREGEPTVRRARR
jgi:hypothetical protein